jgi:hypothetical protein
MNMLNNELNLTTRLKCQHESLILSVEKELLCFLNLNAESIIRCCEISEMPELGYSPRSAQAFGQALRRRELLERPKAEYFDKH